MVSYQEARDNRTRKMIRWRLFIGIPVLVLLIIFLIWSCGSANPSTPAGYAGYITRGAVFGEREFVGVQVGPASPGRAWLLDVIYVSITPCTYTESFDGVSTVLSKDRLTISFSVHITFRIRQDRVREFVERFAYGEAGDADARVLYAYNNFLKEPLRSFARDEVQRLRSTEIADQIPQIGERVTARALEVTSDTPFEILSVVVGNIQFPPVVTAAVSEKMAATQRLEQQTTEVEIAKQKAQIRIAEAHGVAESMQIINRQLTSEYLQHEAIEAQREMAGSPNHTTVYIPVGPMGIPITGTMSVEGGAP